MDGNSSERSSLRRCSQAIAGLLVGMNLAAAGEVGLEEGRRFPELRLPTLEAGEYRSIASFRGEKVLLLVYASW